MSIKNSKNYLGILTGTSMDSIDIAFCNFEKKIPNILLFEQYEYPEKIKSQIRKEFDLLHLLNTKFEEKDNWKECEENITNLYISIIKDFIGKNKINEDDISGIGVHGQTAFYDCNEDEPILIELGDFGRISDNFKFPIIADFRQSDIDFGGRGAPLAPLFHEYVFSLKDINQIVINIGGISNATILMKDKIVSGLDIGPGNGLIDLFMRTFFKEKYDNNGEIAQKYFKDFNDDKTLNLLLDSMLAHKYDKSIGNMVINLHFLYGYMDECNIDSQILVQKKGSQDYYGKLVSLLTSLTSKNIINFLISNNLKNIDEVIICGGGVKNKMLMKLISEELKNSFQNVKLIKSEDRGVNHQTIEACLFAWLAMNYLTGNELNYENITGCSGSQLIGGEYREGLSMDLLDIPTNEGDDNDKD